MLESLCGDSIIELLWYRSCQLPCHFWNRIHIRISCLSDSSNYFHFEYLLLYSVSAALLPLGFSKQYYSDFLRFQPRFDLFRFLHFERWTIISKHCLLLQFGDIFLFNPLLNLLSEENFFFALKNPTLRKKRWCLIS